MVIRRVFFWKLNIFKERKRKGSGYRSGVKTGKIGY
jgi:hypothetical protein